jgi:ABC-2 type transport system ATP-binding protein
MNETAISVNSISKSYGSFRAVDQVSFDVYKGEIFAMLGPNGAGKSTCLRMVLDILKPDSGSISILGGRLDEARKDRIGYLPEERGLYRGVPVLEVMTYLGTLKGMSSKAARARAMSLLERLELGDVSKKKVSELSKGMQQKVQFAVTILHEPELIIVDEPFSGLDPINTLVIKELLLEFRAKGGAVVMSTHQMYQVEEMANRLFMINRGRTALYGSVHEVRSRYALPAVVVEGTGDWSALTGVERVDVRSDGEGTTARAGAMLYLKDGVSSQALLREIAAHPGFEVSRYEQAIPSLNDIFIRVVGGEDAA